MRRIESQIRTDWKIILQEEFQKEYFSSLKDFLIEEKKTYVVYPKLEDIFSAFNKCSFDATKVVIIGQDPYHGPEQAHGLSFSVAEGVRVPSSLRNIFKELHADVSFKIPSHGSLIPWAKQGVLLLNSTLTVREKKASSHQNKGWEQFTNSVIRKISKRKEKIIFLLWGKSAKEKTTFIDETKHHILTAPHPSPLSAHSGFFGCKHFSKTNYLLSLQNQNPINWQT